jgi:UDP-N-acetylbacillosamine N-acetyltransferase
MKIVIYGIGDFAKQMHYYFNNDSPFDVVAFAADKQYISESELDGKPIVAFEDVQKTYPPHSYQMFVAVGYASMRQKRIMYEKAKHLGYTFVNYISTSANIDKQCEIGNNNAILQNAQIEPFVKIGNNNIIWSSVNICHDAIIHNHCFLACQSLIGGFTTIGDNCFVGFNATIIQRIHLETETAVGAKSLVLNHSKPFSKLIGSPAICKSTHKDTGIQI